MKTLRERAIPTTTEVPVHIPTPDGKGIAKTIMKYRLHRRDAESAEEWGR